MMSKKVVVIGSGPGGYVAAIRASQLGHNVTIVERDSIGGVCLNVGCIPSKALIHVGHKRHEMFNSNYLGLSADNINFDFTKSQAWKDNSVIKPLTSGVEMLLIRNKVKIVRGDAKFINKNTLEINSNGTLTKLSFDEAIIATGSKPTTLKAIPFDDVIVDSTGILNLKKVPKNLVVIGGGYIGSELANAYANLGSKVIILEAGPKIISTFDDDMITIAHDNFKKIGVDIKLNAFANKVTSNGGLRTIEYSQNGKSESITADSVLVSIGRTPNTSELGLEKIGVELENNGLIKVNSKLQTTFRNIYAIGDVVRGPALAHKASFEAKIVAEIISGKNVEPDYLAMPSVCFTDIEMASTGLSMNDIKSNKAKYSVTTFPLMANGRALSKGKTEGFVRLITEKGTKVLKGAQIVGDSASELITECSLSIESYLTIDDIALTIHPHPSLSESIMDASELALGLPIHV